MQDFEIADGLLIKYHGRSCKVAVPDGVTAIGAFAFDGCSFLKEISCTAFRGCSALSSVTFEVKKGWYIGLSYGSARMPMRVSDPAKTAENFLKLKTTKVGDFIYCSWKRDE